MCTCSHVDDFNARNKCLIAKHLKQVYRHHKLIQPFFKFYRRHHELVSKFNVGFKSLLHQGLSEPKFCVALVNKFKTIMAMTDFSDHRGSTDDLLLLQIYSLAVQVSPTVNSVYVESSSLLLHNIYLFTVMIHRRTRGLSCEPNNQLRLMCCTRLQKLRARLGP